MEILGICLNTIGHPGTGCHRGIQRQGGTTCYRDPILDSLYHPTVLSFMKAIILEVKTAEPRLLDLKSASNYLGISPSALRLLVDSGQIARVFLPNPRRPMENMDRFLVDKAVLDQLIEKNKERERP